MSPCDAPLVSIVLPIYNVEPYLDRCIESVVSQTYKNIEIILVDDGSKDGCPRICDTWALRDRRIKVIHKENAGLGMARNTGTDNATGEYICYFDSDDYIRKDAIEHIVGCIMETGAELVTFGFVSVDARGETIKSVIPFTPKKIYKGDEVCSWFLPNLIGVNQKMSGKYNLWASAWCFCYSAALIARSGWRFVSEREIISEDVYSLLGLYVHVRSVAVLSEALYCYCLNPRSLSHVYRPDRIAKLAQFYDACVELCDECGYDDEVRRALAQPYLSFLIGAMKQAATNGGRDGYKDIKGACSSGEVHAALADVNMDVQPRLRRLLLGLMHHYHPFLVWVLSRIKGDME